MVHCWCVGNPEVTTVNILVNDSLHISDEVSIPSKYPANLNCFAENDLGQLSNKPTHQYKPSPIPITSKCLVPPDDKTYQSTATCDIEFIFFEG